MAEFVSTLADPVAALAAVGVEFPQAVERDGTLEPPNDVMNSVLAEDRRFVRGELVAEVPDAADEYTGMGGWHINDAHEVHTVLGGRGYLEFITDEGIVGVFVGRGDVMVVRGSEHRYRPITEQPWIIRHSAAPDADMVERQTGRESAPWPQFD